MAVTQKQLAKHVGISHVWVCMALAGHPAVPMKTRERVNRAARELGYGRNTNRGARVMARRRHGRIAQTFSIAVVYPAPALDWGLGYLRNEPYFVPLFAGLEGAACEAGFEIIFCPLRPGELPTAVTSGDVDGVISLFVTGTHFPLLTKLELPIVVCNQRIDNFHSVEPDERDGIRQVVAHLVGLGHRRIAYIGQPLDSGVARERFVGYREALVSYGIEINPVLEEATATCVVPSFGSEAITRLLDRSTDFTAIVCYNDALAMGVVNHLRNIGIQVPEQMSVTGFDDITSEYGFEPAITSVRSPSLEIGRSAIALLRELVEARLSREGNKNLTPVDKSPAFIQRLIVPVELVVRASTARL